MPAPERHFELAVDTEMDLGDLIGSNYRRTPNSHELFGIQFLLHLRHRLSQDVSPSVSVEKDVVAIRFDPVDALDIDENDPAIFLYRKSADETVSVRFCHGCDRTDWFRGTEPFIKCDDGRNNHEVNQKAGLKLIDRNVLIKIPDRPIGAHEKEFGDENVYPDLYKRKCRSQWHVDQEKCRPAQTQR